MARVIIVLDLKEMESQEITEEDVYNYLTSLMKEGDLDFKIED
jgi:hypothetical protein